MIDMMGDMYGHKDKKHDWTKKEWEDHLKTMSKEDLSMKKEMLEKKLSVVNDLLKEKK
jgi:hypothetical protein